MDSSKVNIAILILAAGASSRMGGPKQLLPWGNTTLLGHSINMAKGTNAVLITVVLGAHANAVKLAVPMEGINHVLNPNWESGLGNSLAFGVEFLTKREGTYDGILVMLCDQPLMDTEYLNNLIDQFSRGEKGIVATQYGEKVGVPAIFGSKYFPHLLQLNEDFGAKNLLEQCRNDVLSLDPFGKAVDIDTFEEYQSLLRNQLEFGA